MGKYQTTITAACVSGNTDAVEEKLDALVTGLQLPDAVEQAEDTMDQMMRENFTALGKAIAAANFPRFPCDGHAV